MAGLVLLGISQVTNPFSLLGGTNDFVAARLRMVKEQIESRGIRDTAVLQTISRVPRHEFVTHDLAPQAYMDRPLPIGHDQTISQPYVVAFMTEALKPKKNDKVLEIGTGSGYQAAVLSLLVDRVYTIEIVPELARRAAADLTRLGYTNVMVRSGDGYKGWPEAAPFDAIIVTCAPERVPSPLTDQLRNGGRMIIPVGNQSGQDLILLRKSEGGLTQDAVLPVRFVPMTGESLKHR